MNRTEKRAWDLYNLLMTAPDKWWSQEEIYNWVEGYKYINRNNDRCPTIRNDMLWLNNNAEVEKIIVCKNYQFKIATKEETREYYKARIRRLKNQLKQIKDLEFKIHADGHFDFIDEVWLESFAEDNEKCTEDNNEN